MILQLKPGDVLEDLEKALYIVNTGSLNVYAGVLKKEASFRLSLFMSPFVWQHFFLCDSNRKI